MASKIKIIDCMTDLEAAGLRSFKKEHLDSLSKQLYSIKDDDLDRLTKEYIRLPDHPKSFVGWVINKVCEENEDKNQYKLNPNHGVGVEYTREDAKLYLDCVWRAIALYGGLSDEYKMWVEWFNNKWIGNDGEKLTEFLQAHYHSLLNEKKIYRTVNTIENEPTKLVEYLPEVMENPDKIILKEKLNANT